jgi:hypothetical protein
LEIAFHDAFAGAQANNQFVFVPLRGHAIIRTGSNCVAC